MVITKSDLKTRFTYHPPSDAEKPPKFVAIRENAYDFASLINDLSPDSREKSIAITKLEEAVMWANAAIARSE